MFEQIKLKLGYSIGTNGPNELECLSNQVLLD